MTVSSVGEGVRSDAQGKFANLLSEGPVRRNRAISEHVLSNVGALIRDRVFDRVLEVVRETFAEVFAGCGIPVDRDSRSEIFG